MSHSVEWIVKRDLLMNGLGADHWPDIQKQVAEIEDVQEWSYLLTRDELDTSPDLMRRITTVYAEIAIEYLEQNYPNHIAIPVIRGMVANKGGTDDE